MAKKAKQRFGWTYDHPKGTISVLDTETDQRLNFQVADYPEEIQEGFKGYGLGKKLQDSQSQTAAADKLAGFTATHEQLLAGKWSADRQVGSRFLPPIIEVIMSHKGWSVSKAQASYRALDEDARAELRKAQATQILAIEEARKAQIVESLDDMI